MSQHTKVIADHADEMAEDTKGLGALDPNDFEAGWEAAKRITRRQVRRRGSGHLLQPGRLGEDFDQGAFLAWDAAKETYDPARGTKFSTWLWIQCRGQIAKVIRDDKDGHLCSSHATESRTDRDKAEAAGRARPRVGSLNDPAKPGSAETYLDVVAERAPALRSPQDVDDEDALAAIRGCAPEGTSESVPESDDAGDDEAELEQLAKEFDEMVCAFTPEELERWNARRRAQREERLRRCVEFCIAGVCGQAFVAVVFKISQQAVSKRVIQTRDRMRRVAKAAGLVD